MKIRRKLEELILNNDDLKEMLEFFEEALVYRMIGQYKSDFKDLSDKFILLIFTMLKNGTLHAQIKDHELLQFLAGSFNGFPFLIQKVKKFMD